VVSYWLSVADADGVVCPCLWVGTSLGSILVIAFGMPADGGRNTEPVSVMPSGMHQSLLSSLLCAPMLLFGNGLEKVMLQQFHSVHFGGPDLN